MRRVVGRRRRPSVRRSSLSISSPSCTSSLSSVNEGLGGSRSYGSGAWGVPVTWAGKVLRMARTLTQRELNRALLARQGLLERRDAPLPRRADAMGGMQAQYAPSMYIGLWSRVAGLRARRASRAALERRAVIQATLMRLDDPPRLARRLLAAGARRSASAPARLVAAGDARAHDRHGRRRPRRCARRSRTARSSARRARGADRQGRVAHGIGLWLDMVRVPPSGTWERRRADLYGLAEAWVGAAARRTPRRHARPPLPARASGRPRKAEIANWAGLASRTSSPTLERARAAPLRGRGRRRAARPPGRAAARRRTRPRRCASCRPGTRPCSSTPAAR